MAESSKQLSIITVSSNDFERVKRTVESLLGVDRRVEHIIVLPFNDSESIDFLVDFLEQNPNVALSYVHDKGEGIYQAMAIGVAQATARYFTFWNAGDVLSSTEELSKMLNHVSLCSANWVLTNGQFDWIEYPTPSLANLTSFMLQEKGGYVSHQCILFKTDWYFEREVFNLNYKVAADTHQIYESYQRSIPELLDFSIVCVEPGTFSAINNRRARLEVLVIVGTKLRGLNRLKALKNFLTNELSHFLGKIPQIR